MRALAITGMVTAALMPSMRAGSLIRATPPSRRMSAGTRSSAMTATAPGILGDLGLLGVDHVHDHPAAEHLGEAPLDGEGAGRTVGARTCRSSLHPAMRVMPTRTAAATPRGAGGRRPARIYGLEHRLGLDLDVDLLARPRARRPP